VCQRRYTIVCITPIIYPSFTLCYNITLPAYFWKYDKGVAQGVQGSNTRCNTPSEFLGKIPKYAKYLILDAFGNKFMYPQKRTKA
jgi:hypothetical protein